MNAKNKIFRTAGLLAGVLILPSSPLRAAAETDALPTFDENYIKVSAAGMDISGSRAAAQRRTQLPKVGAAGIEAFNVTRELSKVTSLVIDGQALPGAEDYLAQVRMEKKEVGSFEAGYKTFRTFYDGVGGFFPTNSAWVPLQKRALYIDRGKFYVNATVALPKAPVFAFRYTNATRDGRKDSTIWGDTSFTGIPNYSLAALNPVSIARKYLPALNRIDERRQTIEGSVTQTFGKTTALRSLVGTRINNLNSRTVDRFNGELRPFPTIPANPVTVIPARLSNNPNFGYDTQGLKEDSWNLTGKVETALSDTMSVYGSVSYRTSDGDISASRLINLTLASNAGPINGIGGFVSAGRPPYSYTSAGTVKMDIYTANVGLNLKPTKEFALDVGVKAEDASIIAHNFATYVSTFMNQTTGAVAAPQLNPAPNWSRTTQKVWSPELNARYTGIKQFTLFGSVDYRSSPGDYRNQSVSVGPGPAGSSIVLASIGATEEKEKEKYLNAKVGFIWAPATVLNLRAEVFTKDHENRFEGYGESAGDLYVLDYNIYGTRITATFRPVPTWSFLTRYTAQMGDASVLTDTYAKGDSKDAKRYSISETATWTPDKVLFVQGSVNFVYDTISTAYPKAGGLANDVLRNADNNYWTGNLLFGFVVDKMTNAQIQGTYYKANNYEPSLAAATMPYGAGGREYSISCGVTRKFSDRWLGSAKVGYFNSRNDTAGGNSDFHGPLAYLSMQHAF
jgi:hypothetical protein